MFCCWKNSKIRKVPSSTLTVVSSVGAAEPGEAAAYPDAHSSVRRHDGHCSGGELQNEGRAQSEGLSAQSEGLSAQSEGLSAYHDSIARTL